MKCISGLWWNAENTTFQQAFVKELTVITVAAFARKSKMLKPPMGKFRPCTASCFCQKLANIRTFQCKTCHLATSHTCVSPFHFLSLTDLLTDKSHRSHSITDISSLICIYSRYLNPFATFCDREFCIVLKSQNRSWLNRTGLFSIHNLRTILQNLVFSLDSV